MSRLQLEVNGNVKLFNIFPVSLRSYSSKRTGNYEIKYSNDYVNITVDVDNLFDPLIITQAGDYVFKFASGFYMKARYVVSGTTLYREWVAVYLPNQQSAWTTPSYTHERLDVQDYIYAVSSTIDDTLYEGLFFRSGSGGSRSWNVILCNPYIYESSVIPPYGGNLEPSPDGYGSHDRSSDQVGASPLPSNIIPVGSGLNIYTLTPAAFHKFESYLWGSTEFLWTALWGRFASMKYNPIGSIVACYALPTTFTPSGATVNGVQLAGVNLAPINAGSEVVQSISTQFIDSDYTLRIEPFYGDYLDYEGTVVILHLPFVGTVSVDPNYCVNGGLTIKYRVDVFSGNVGVFLIGTNRSGNSECFMTLTGNCMYDVPVTGHDDGLMRMLATRIGNTVSEKLDENGNENGESKNDSTNLGSTLVSVARDLFVNKHKTMIISSDGGVSAVTNLNLYAELIYVEPTSPDNYTELLGRPSDVGGVVSDFSGFTIFREVDTKSLNCMDNEKEEIRNLLIRGVFL